MGFESSEVARRRLARLAARNGRVQAALASSTFPGIPADLPTPEEVPFAPYPADASRPSTGASAALVRQLDDLAQDIVSTPGAGGALLAAYAAQARAMSMVVEAARRSGAGPLPSAVLRAAQDALAASSAVPGFALG